MEALAPAAEPTTVETPAPAAVESPSVGLHEMTRPERDSFLRDGKMPTREPKVSDEPADPSTAPAEGKKAAEIAAKETAPASEPGKPAKDKKDARNSAKQRTEELDVEIRELNDRLRIRRELQRQLAEAEQRPKSDGKPDSSTKEQPSEPKWKQTAADKAFPKISDFESPDEWAAAVTEYTRAQIESGLSAKDQQSAEAQEVRQVAERAFTRGVSEVEADPTILDRIDPELESLPGARAMRAAGQEPNVNHFIKDALLFESERPLAMMEFYSTPEGKREWNAMRGMTEQGRTRTIIARELSLGQPVKAGEATAPEKKPAAKTFTKTPNPPEKEGPKGTQPVDGAKAAVETGDFAEFERRMDAQGDGLTRRFGRRRG